MKGFLIRLAISSLGLWVASAIVPGLSIRGVPTLVLGALLLGVVNAFVRPVVVFLTFPITLVTLGLFLLVINAAMLGLVAALLDGFSVTGLLPAVLGSLVVSFISWIASWNIGSSGRMEVIYIERR